ncbi:hypothetical protein PQC30_24905 (plasmid) [Salmonella enterica subsp. diarizonae]|nr:hypothetical protein [Salmonella enterica]UAM87988.1 hypothetical protein K8I78_24765 [Salmonella enterica subsp. arizonae]WKN80438.1 hypothetical protein PQC30_24905 [Salmonella enterica subsp. diarizonae]
MRSRPSLLLMRNLRSLAVVVLATLPCVAFAQWRVVAVSTEVDKMRFNTIIDAHSFMKNYRSGEEEPRQPGGCKLKTAPVRPVVAARPAEYVCSEDLFY